MALIKLITTLIIQFEFWDFVKDLVISPFSSVQVEQAIIMLIIPFFVNILLFWVTDNFLMHRNHSQNKTMISHISNGKTMSNGFGGRAKVHYLNHHGHSGNDSESDALITDYDDSDVEILKREPESGSGIDDYLAPRRKHRSRFNINVWPHGIGYISRYLLGSISIYSFKSQLDTVLWACSVCMEYTYKSESKNPCFMFLWNQTARLNIDILYKCEIFKIFI